jgi:ubiquinone/menaquinone biosynthesis C-methylase UbiE
VNQPTFPELYEQLAVNPLFRPWAELTLDEVNAAPGDRILDIACGTGIVARVAKARLGDAGSIVGVDVNSGMLAVARRIAPGIDWREGDAAALPLREGERFDIVVCQQGLQFFSDKPAAVAQMERALAPGGRLAVSTWRPDEEIPFSLDMRRAVERHLGPITDQRHSFGDAFQLQTLLSDAGFRQIRFRTISRIVRVTDSAPFLRLNTMALVGMSAAGQRMDEEQRKRLVDVILDEIAGVLQPYTHGSGLAFELQANLATATC